MVGVFLFLLLLTQRLRSATLRVWPFPTAPPRKETPMHEIRQIGIVGTGVMGAGIAKVLAAAGYAVNLVKWRDGGVDAARGAFEQSVAKDVERGKLAPEDASRLLQRIVWSDRHRHGLDRCDLVIEAIKE